MKFIENFKIHKNVSGNVVNIAYLENSVQNAPNALWNPNSESQDSQTREQPAVETISTIHVKVKTLHIRLENKKIKSQISKDQIAQLKSIGHDPLYSVQSAMTNEQDLGLEKELFYLSLQTASELNSFEEFKGIQKWFYNLVGYRPKIWVEDQNFINMIYESSQEILKRTRQGDADWIVVSPIVASILLENPSIILPPSDNNSFNPTSMVNEVGRLNSLRIYSSLLIDNDQILIGRRSKDNHDQLVSAAITESEWINVDDFMGINHIIGLKRGEKVFAIPGSENSYVKWNFSIENPSFWKWFFNLFRK
jgi:hypothetical protein